jgi:hypothetical protein
MEEALNLNQSEIFDVVFLKKEQNTQLLSYFQNTQASSLISHLAVINNQINNKTLLLIYGNFQAFLLEIENANTPELERFFANLQFFVETEKELATLLHNLPLEQNNIFDVKIAKSLVQNAKFPVNVPFLKLNAVDIPDDINISYIKNLIIKGLENSQIWLDIIKTLKKQSRFEMYESIILERFHKLKLFNSVQNNLGRISELYNILSQREKEAINEVFEIVHSISIHNNIPKSSIVNLQALEVLALKLPITFDEISHIAGFNKKHIHNAVIRKILNIFININSSIKRDRPLEMVLDAILTSSGIEYGIEKNFIASKHEIIICLNGNLNVDFLKGWKKSVFGGRVLDFLENRSFIEAKNMEFCISYK